MTSRPIQELALLIAEFPGIGPRQARRIVQFLLGKDAQFREKIATLVKEIREKTSQCSVCFRYDDAKTNGTCTICSDESRNKTELMVVEKDVDIESVEASGAYRGHYFVLGGLMAMVERKHAPVIRVAELLARIKKNGITEVVLAFSTTPEGDYTSRAIVLKMEQHFPDKVRPKISFLGRGLSVGAEIEYADPETLRSALNGRSSS